MSWPYAAGALVSSVDDLARWNAAIAARKLLSPDSWARATTPHRLKTGIHSPFGYGFVCAQFAGRSTLEHGGGIPGFSSYALYLPTDDVFIAVLSNDDRMNILSLLATLFRRDDTASLARKLARYALAA